ncbi:hypothetical protein GS464_24540 [Rhodococcus hoagii]|nr:hypothetical protein [Prescottella equi]MBM4657397.1 hypothetical protein [Prescottella equi]MBM4720225.1 hypothetical protein [Prescottella equi]MBM4720291.1 hypothetical protein [Prescottella equi]
MSTAEQITPVRILAKHRLDDFDGTCTCGEWSYEDEPYDPADPELASMHSAHVVAALTNAGKAIVDSAGIGIEYGIERDMPSGGVRVVAAYDRSTAERVMEERPHDTRLVQRQLHIGEWEPAAARVAEGGDQP